MINVWVLIYLVGVMALYAITTRSCAYSSEVREYDPSTVEAVCLFISILWPVFVPIIIVVAISIGLGGRR